MAQIPALPSYSVGSRWTAARALEVKAAVDFHNTPPAASVSRVSSAQSVPNNANTAIQFDTEDFDTDGIANLGANNDRLTIVTPGLYLVTGSVAFVSNATGNRSALLTKNGAVIARSMIGPVSSNAVGVGISKLVRLAATDYLTLLGYQASGAALNTDIGGGGSFLQASWIGA